MCILYINWVTLSIMCLLHALFIALLYNIMVIGWFSLYGPYYIVLCYFMYILLNFSLKIEYLKINILSLHLLDNLDMFIFSKM